MSDKTANEITGNELVALWLEIIGKGADDPSLSQTIDVLTQIANAPSDKAFRYTQRAITFGDLIGGFETEKAGGAEALMRQAKEWYDHVEEIFRHVVDAYGKGDWGVGSADKNLRMRRLVGISTLLGITSPSVKVPHNILMTLIGATVSEIQLREMLEKAQQTDPTMTFEKLVQRVVDDYDTLRTFLSGVEEKIYGSSATTPSGEPLSAYIITEKEAPMFAPEKGKRTVVLPQYTSPTTTVTLSGQHKTLKVKMSRMMSSNMLRGILSYLDALSRPELGNGDPVSKWTAKEFFEFYSQVAEQLSTAETPQAEKELLSAFIEREKHLRFGKGEIPKESTEAVYAPIRETSPTFANALRRFIINNFGASASKTKSFSVSAFFSAVAEKLGIGSSVLPSVVFDTWMNANLHNMLREIDEMDTTAPRLAKVTSVIRQAILPYGFDVEIGEGKEGLSIRLKDYLEGKVYEQEGRGYKGKAFTDPTDIAIHNRFTGKDKKASPIYRAIANAFRERRMYLYSPLPEMEGEKSITRLLDFVKVSAYGKSEEAKKSREDVKIVGRQSGSTEEAGKLMIKDIDDLLKHWMTTHYTEDGHVFLVKGNPFFEMLEKAGGREHGLIKTVNINGVNTDVIYLSDVVGRDDIYLHPVKRGSYTLVAQPQPKDETLQMKYKKYIDRFRTGGFIGLLGEQTLKNALYLPEGAKEGEGRLNIRALQALVWVCTRKSL